MFLVGLMGAGKSSVGRALAARLRRDYVDNDTELLHAQGQDAVALSHESAAALHEAEAVYVESLFVRPGAFVASLPASVADRAALAQAVNDSGFVVYLRAHPAVLAQRVAADPTRPWLATSAAATLADMFDHRDARFGAMADLSVNTDSLNTEGVVAAILGAVTTPQ
jgi:shikimate kinase